MGKNIVFDLMVSQPSIASKYHGGGEYAKTVFNELCEKYGERINLTAFYNPDKYLDDWIFEKAKSCKAELIPVRSYGEVSKLEKFREGDTFVACLLDGVCQVEKPEKMRIIGVYHGFRELEKTLDITTPLYQPSLKGAIKKYIKLVVKNRFFKKYYIDYKSKIESCSDIIGVSEHSGYSAKVFYPDFDESHIHIFYPPRKHVEHLLSEMPPQEKTVLMLGGNRWIKNTYRGIKALDELFSNGLMKDYSVKVVGGIPKYIKSRIKNSERFIPIPYLLPEELEKQYCACDIFLYPTLNEGFGYPPEEAMKYGKTCIISGINSLIEVYQDSAYYCNPYDIHEMKCRLLLASEQKIDKEIIERNLKRLHKKQDEDLEALCSLIVGNGNKE